MTSTMPLLSLESAAMLCRVDPVVAWASSFVDGWAPCFLGQEVESRVCFPFTPVGGFVASTPMVTCKGLLFRRVCSPFTPLDR